MQIVDNDRVAREGNMRAVAALDDEVIKALEAALKDLKIPEGKTISAKRLSDHAQIRFIAARGPAIRRIIARLPPDVRAKLQLPPKLPKRNMD